MAAVAIVTDTTHYLPPELVRSNGIHQVSLYVHWRGRQDRESDLPDFDEYYDELRTAERLPTTSQPSIGDFIEVWGPLLADGGELVSIHIAGGISGTVAAAEQAREKLGEEGRGGDRVTIVDSATSCGGLGLVVLAAAAAARAGATSEQVAERARVARDALGLWFCVDTMEFLRRGGRVGAARAWLGSTLKIKPILALENEITPVERVRTSGRAFERMVGFLAERRDAGADGWVVQHIQDPERAGQLVERGRELFGSEPAFVSEVGPVIGTHVGPGLLGVGGIPAELMR